MEHLFNEGYKKFNENNFEGAESLFLQCLSEYAKKGEPFFYLGASGSLDHLALKIYPKKVNDISRSYKFYKLMSDVDMNASIGFVYALVNNTLGNKKDKKEEIFRQLSKASETQQHVEVIYILHSFFLQGYYVDKSIENAVYLLAYCIKRKGNYRINDAEESLSKIFKDNENSSFSEILKMDFESIEREVKKILASILPSDVTKIDIAQRHQKVIALFNEIEFTSVELEPKIDEKPTSLYPSLDHQDLDEAFMTGAYPIVFKQNPKYCKDDFLYCSPFISLADINENKYIIRGTLNRDEKDNNKPIIVQYNELWNIIDDGWRLD
jgi:hypothetical protein